MRCRFSTALDLFCTLVVVEVFLLKDTGATEFQLRQPRCRRVVKQHTRLAEGGLQASSRVIRSEYPVRTASQCYAHCCNYIADDGSRCNAAIYDSDESDQLELLTGGTCLLLNCGPTFKDCLWQSGPFIQSSVAHIIHKRTTQTNVNSLTAVSNTTTSSMKAEAIMSAPTSATDPLLADPSDNQTPAAETTTTTTSTTTTTTTTTTPTTTESSVEQKQLALPMLPTASFSFQENVTTSSSPPSDVSTTEYSDYDDEDYPSFFNDKFNGDELDHVNELTATDATTTTTSVTTTESNKFDNLWDVARALSELQRKQPTVSKGSLVTAAPTAVAAAISPEDVGPDVEPDLLTTTTQEAPVPENAPTMATNDIWSAAQSNLSPNDLERHDDVMNSNDLQSTVRSGIIDMAGNLNNPWDGNDDHVKIAAIFVPDKATVDDVSPENVQSPVIVLAFVSMVTLIGLSIGLLIVICRRLMGVSKTRYMPLREDVFGADSSRPEFPTNYLVASSRQSARLLPK